MEEHSLKLTIEKGPREGETLVHKPGSCVRIGRVIKGNTFSIKDAGISSKHMLIEFKDAKWVVSDLESSNGTFLNNVKLQALVTYDLRDGDMIKIGEGTSIKVSIVEEAKVDKRSKRVERGASVEAVDELVAENGESQVRRNPRRRAATKNVPKGDPAKNDSEVQIVTEKSNLAAGDCGEAKVLPPLRGRTRRGAKARTGALEDGELKESSEVQGIPGSSNVGPEGSTDQDNAVTVGENRTRRAALKNQPVESDSVAHKTTGASNLSGESCREAADVAPVVEEKPRPVGARRRTRSSRDNDEPSVLVSGLPEIPELSCLGQESCREPGNKVLVEALERHKVSEDEILAPVSVPSSDAQLVLSYSEKDTCKESNRELENVVGLAENQTQRGARRRMRASKNEPAGSVSEVHKFTESEPENAAPVEQKLRQRATRRTRSLKDDNEPSVSVSVSEVPDAPESSNLGKGSCRELENGVHVEDQAGKVTLEGIEASEDVVQLGGANSQKVSAGKEPMITSAVKENPAGVGDGKELEKMTLGEWFDHLEVSLSKQIYDTTEEIILGMRESAKKFNEFMSQQQHVKAKQPAV